MKMVRKPKLLSSIRAKLFSAVAMLLVAVIMVVSSTYAWFTLSTAPEVTGMTTAIGANGSLEMALMPTDGLASSITSEVGDSVKDATLKNVTWGNLVDLSDNTAYGLDKITLLPSAMDYSLDEATGVKTLTASMLKVPQYGADGRISEMLSNVVTGNYNVAGANFIPGSNYGFRALGVTSGMTDRQLAYRNARSAANTAKAQAANAASQSLNNNGSALANIAIAYGMSGSEATFTSDDVNALKAIVTDLQDNILPKIDLAYMQYMLAYAASAEVDNDAAWSTVQSLIVDGATADSVIAQLATQEATQGMMLPTAITDPIDELEATRENVDEASGKLDAITKTEGITWAELKDVMTLLAATESMTINDYAAGEVKDKLGDLVSSVTAMGGLVVKMTTGGGVYADVADHCGDYTASITIEKVEYNGIVLNDMAARMETASTEIPPYLGVLGTAVEGAGAPSSDGTTQVMPISEFYGYVLDLAFRTNAADSKLLLQTDAIDRIYGEENNNDNTMGHGSSMTFASTSTFFTNEQVKKLMKGIRIVFFTPSSSVVLAEARLDTDNATIGTDGVTAKMYLYDQSAAQTGTYNDGFIKEEDESIIQALNQNTATAVSVLVYLDGENIGNGDVAFSNAQSVTGKMNLQFASSAALVPMKTGNLYTPNKDVSGSDTPAQGEPTTP